MNRPKRTNKNQFWSVLQAGRPNAFPAVALSPEAGSPAPASAAGYVNRPSSLPAATTPVNRLPVQEEVLSHEVINAGRVC